MIGPEPLIPWRFCGPVIAFEVAVVQLVMEIGGIEDRAVADDQLFETRVREGRSETAAVEVHQQNHGMGWDYEMDQHRGNVEDVFHRVHGHSGPWSDVDIAMVQSMDGAIERRPVQQPMNGVEVRGGDDGHRQQPEYKSDGMFGQCDCWNCSASNAMEVEDFVDGPDR